MIYTVVCTDINDYVNWQCELLEYSWSRINQPGKLVRLVACDDDQALPEHRHADVFRTRPSNVHPDSGDHYVCYNRLYSLQQWLNTEDIQGTILIVDSDVIFRSAINTLAPRGKPIAQHWLDYGVSPEFREAISNASPSLDVDSLQPATWPALIDADDLRELLPRWIAATVSIREQIKRQESDMFGFLIAAQEKRLEFELGTTTAFMPWPDEQVAGAPIVHYCQAVKNQSGEKLWSKFDYQPWQRVHATSTAELPYCVDLLNQVDEYARLKNSEVKHHSDTIFIAIASYCEPELLDTIHSCLSKARHPQNLRFGICHQFDNTNSLTDEHCLEPFSQDIRFRYVCYDYRDSKGGCWARNIAQQLYQDEVYTLQIDAHTQMLESWDTILIDMLNSLPSNKPLITQFPPLYSIEQGQLNFHHNNDLSRVNIGIAKAWEDEGWLHHTQQQIPQHNHFPRRTRLLSGAFVFTSGDWNERVMQDPEHFYTGEEFALAIRSYTHGYDLFDPSQIVAWHRLHPENNRKFWDDNSDTISNAKHKTAIDRLNLLFNGDPEEQLGIFGLGNKRNLQDYARFSGIDCINKTISDEARQGVPPQLIPEQDTTMDKHTATANHNAPLIDITVHLEKRQPLFLSCAEDTPILMSLFQGLRRKSEYPDDVIYLNIGQHDAEQIFFKQKQLLAIETNPPLSTAFFEHYVAQNQVAEEAHQIAQDSNRISAEEIIISDDWKIWIWKNVEKGCSKDDILQELLSRGFPESIVRKELNYQSAMHQPLLNDAPKAINNTQIAEQSPYVANPAAQRIDNDKLEMYSVDGFLNEHECGQLYELIVDNLQRSTIINISNADESSHRTSSTCFFDLNDPKNALAAATSARISKFIGIDASYAEPIQAQFYKPGEEYKPHLDWIDPNSSAEAQTNIATAGQRTWSVLVYLNNVPAGGETNFANANLIIKPELGKMVFWNNAKGNGELNTDTLHQAKPVLEGEKVVLTLWYRSIGNGIMYQRQANELIPRYTVDGIKKQTMPIALFETLSTFYASAKTSEQKDEFVEGDFLQSASNNVPSSITEIPDSIKELIYRELLAICEEWSKKPLKLTAIYGIRNYARGTSLKMHTDTSKTHIISVILNIAQTVDEDWPLQVDDHMSRRHSIVLKPGDMLLYEGGRLSHGRPDAFKGDNYANIFVHFCPTDFGH